VGFTQNVTVRVSALDNTRRGLGAEREKTRVSAVTRETSVLGTREFEAPSIFAHGNDSPCSIASTKKQRNTRLWSVQHSGRTGPNAIFTFVDRCVICR
jgi:hypothetical protein